MNYLNSKSFNIFLRIGFIISFFTAVQLKSMLRPQVVNGCNALWDKRYNEAAFPATHNGQSHEESAVQNQAMPLLQQFEKGIRATKIHVWNDFDAQTKKCRPMVCHGVTKEMLEGSYLQKVIDKIPRMFRSWAVDILKDMEPLNELIRQACKAAYGDGDKAGVIQFNHCILDPARRSLATILGEVKQFLASNVNEVITIILEDHTKNLDQLSEDFEKSGLMKYVHKQDKNAEWPKLGAMVSEDKRLVVFLQSDETNLPYEKHPWLHNLWEFAWDTEWDFQETNDLKDITKDVMPKRGIQAFNKRKEGAKNKVFIVNHFVTPLTGGCKKEAVKVNKKAFLQARLERLSKIADHKPNIIQIDFFEHPNSDVLELVNAMNNEKKIS